MTKKQHFIAHKYSAYTKVRNTVKCVIMGSQKIYHFLGHGTSA